jgi:hypothetical protein
MVYLYNYIKIVIFYSYVYQRVIPTKWMFFIGKMMINQRLSSRLGSKLFVQVWNPFSGTSVDPRPR